MRVENTLRRGELILKPGLRLETRVRWVDLQVLNNIFHEHDHVEDNSDCQQCFATGLITCARDSCAVLAVATSTLNKSAIGLFRSLYHHHHHHHHHLHHDDSPAILNMVSPQCSVLREAFSTFEMRARISSFHYFSVFQSRPSRQDIDNFCLSVMCKCWRRGLKPHKIVLHDNHHTSIIIRTLNISERTQTFTTVSVASKFQTWTLLTILFGLLRLVSYANIARSQSTNMEWYKRQ